MAAPERFAEKSDSSCTAGTVHTWPEAAVRCNATILPVLEEKRTSRRHRQTDARLTYRCIWTAKNDDRFDPEAEVDERCLPMSIYELTG
jgi:hypothetical protein